MSQPMISGALALNKSGAGVLHTLSGVLSPVPSPVPSPAPSLVAGGGPTQARSRSSGRTPGRPVNPALKDTILSAISRVLVREGYNGLTIIRVAKEAGVSTATVYRRWPAKQEMFFDAVRLWRDDLTPRIDTGSLRGDVDALISARVRFLATPLGYTFGMLLGEAVQDPEFGDLLREISILPARTQMAEFVERAVRRGETLPRHAPETVLDVLLSTIHFRATNMLASGPMDVEANLREIRSVAACLMAC